MLLSRLAKANTQNFSPKSANSGHHQTSASASKRATLEIFSQFRSRGEEVSSNQDRDTDDEIEAMLNQNLFRENLGTPNHALTKQFQIASDVSLLLILSAPLLTLTLPY